MKLIFVTLWSSVTSLILRFLFMPVSNITAMSLSFISSFSKTSFSPWLLPLGKPLQFMHIMLISSSSDPAFSFGLISMSSFASCLDTIASFFQVLLILNIRDLFGILSDSDSPSTYFILTCSDDAILIWIQISALSMGVVLSAGPASCKDTGRNVSTASSLWSEGSGWAWLLRPFCFDY